MLKLKLLIVFLFLPIIVFAQNPEWKVFKSTHFLVYYKQASEYLLQELSQKVECYYDEITEEFGFNRINFWTWDNRAKIYLYDNQDEYKKVNRDLAWSSGAVIVRNKSIQTYITAQGLLDNVLAHELAHIIFREMVGFGNPAVPLWLEEGVASFQERRAQNLSVKNYLADKIRSGNFMNLDQLRNFSTKTAENKQVINLFYVESYSLVNYLISEFGKDKFVLFCQYLRDKKDLTRAFRFAYSFDSLEDLESAWKVSILK